MRNTLAPYVYSGFKIHKSAAISGSLSLFYHITTTFTALHDKLIENKVVEMDRVVYVFWK